MRPPILALLLFCPATVFAQAPVLAAPDPASLAAGARVLTLREAFDLALSNNIGLDIARADVNAADAQRRVALSQVRPRVNVLGNLVGNSNEAVFQTPDGARTILPTFDWSVRVVATQPLYAGLRELRTYDQAKLGVLNAQSSLRSREEDVLLRVGIDYLAAVEAGALVDVEQKSLDLANRRRQQSDDLYTAGEVTRVDVLRAETAIKEAERRLVSARLARENALSRLRLTLARDDPFGVSDPAWVSQPLPDEASLIRQAEAERPEIAEAERTLAIARLEVKKQVGAYQPVLTADAGYIRQKSSFPQTDYAYAAVRFTVPVFQGGETAARVALARERERQASLVLADLRQRVREEVRTSLLDLTAARTSLALAEEQVRSAEAEYEQVFELYRGQEATSLDADQAETSLAQARRAVIASRLALRLSEMRAWYSAGLLKPVIFQERVP